jgi:hypothetical protein
MGAYPLVVRSPETSRSPYYRGGPKGGQVLLASAGDGYMVFDDGQAPCPKYKLTAETVDVDGVTYPIAIYVTPDSPA